MAALGAIETSSTKTPTTDHGPRVYTNIDAGRENVRLKTCDCFIVSDSFLIQPRDNGMVNNDIHGFDKETTIYCMIKLLIIFDVHGLLNKRTSSEQSCHTL